MNHLSLDSSALIALLRREDGADAVQALLDDPDNLSFMHAVNLCEVYYGFRRAMGESYAERMVQVVQSMSIGICEDMDTAFWQEAGRFKADLVRISLADCFCLALAKRVDGEVVTADHHELDAVARQGSCKIRFIR